MAHDVAQHTPVTQKPLAHSVPAVQAVPRLSSVVVVVELVVVVVVVLGAVLPPPPLHADIAATTHTVPTIVRTQTLTCICSCLLLL